MESFFTFKLLNDQLTVTEFQQFLSTCTRDMLSGVFFKAFVTSPEGITPFTNITKKIINAREPKPKSQDIASCSNLQELPPEIILHCASFLETSEYVRFSYSSSKIYISIYSPSQIQTLPLKAFTNCINSDYKPKPLIIKRFKNISDLSIRVEDFNDEWKNISIWNNNNKLTTLQIYQEFSGDIDEDATELTEFINNKKINLCNITTLKLTKTTFKNNSFCDLVSNFPNTEFLDLYNVSSINENDSNSSNLRKALPNLKRFVYNKNSNISHSILMACRNQLQSLHLQNHPESVGKFPKLTELYILSAKNIKNTIPILNGTYVTNLQKFKLNCNNNTCSESIARTLFDKQYLEHLCIDNTNVSMLSILEASIFSSQNKQRKSKKLLIECGMKWCTELFNKNKMDLFVNRLVQQFYIKDKGKKIKEI